MASSIVARSRSLSSPTDADNAHPGCNPRLIASTLSASHGDAGYRVQEPSQGPDRLLGVGALDIPFGHCYLPWCTEHAAIFVQQLVKDRDLLRIC
jgi:hypothetical protein